MSEQTVAAFREDGFSTLRSLICSSDLTLMLRDGFPPKGFVGRVSSSFRGGGLDSYKLKSIHLRPIPSTLDAPRWRLTLEWETSQLPALRSPSGRSSGRSGGRSGGAGGAGSRHRTRTTSILSPWTLGRVGPLRAPHPPD